MTAPVHHLRATQRGAALFMALIVLVLVTLVTLAALATSLLQLRMSSNNEMQQNVQQQAQAGIDDVIHINFVANQAATKNSQLQYFAIQGNLDDTSCTPNLTSSPSGVPCTRQTITLSSPLDGTKYGPSMVAITRKSDPTTNRTACGTSAMFEIESIYDKSSLGQGKADVVEGYDSCIYTPPGPAGGLPITAAQN